MRGLNAVLVLSMVPTAPSLHGLSVLVIDDHRDTVDVLLEYFTACGATAFGAGSAKSALAIVEAHMVDAAVVDLRMPREDGWWFLSQLRESRTSSAQAPVYAISGERHDQLDPASGFAGFFFKPVDLDTLTAALAALPRRSP
jgi:CheY-like chemotaxis protein